MTNPRLFYEAEATEHRYYASEITLRDLFAAACISNFKLSKRNVSEIMRGAEPAHGVVAQFCYGLADAMLAERAKEGLLASEWVARTGAAEASAERAEGELAEMRAERRRDGLDGQAALDEANNALAAALARERECKAAIQYAEQLIIPVNRDFIWRTLPAVVRALGKEERREKF